MTRYFLKSVEVQAFWVGADGEVEGAVPPWIERHKFHENANGTRSFLFLDETRAWQEVMPETWVVLFPHNETVQMGAEEFALRITTGIAPEHPTLRWGPDGFRHDDRGLWVGGLWVGGIEDHTASSYGSCGWRGWLMVDCDGERVGYYGTEQEARDALMAEAAHALDAMPVTVSLKGRSVMTVNGRAGVTSVSGATECGCMRCQDERTRIVLASNDQGGSSFALPGMDKHFRYACEICGNKRCSHHTDHDLVCTGSNEPGQPGSAYQ